MAYRLGVDVGGTFTDLFLVDDDRAQQWRVKTPSTPRDPSDGVLTGVERICAEAGIAPGDLRNLVHGTTVATNAVLESKGARVGLITTQGFGQILHLARSQTPGPLAGWIIMVKPDPPAALEDTREARERMSAQGELNLLRSDAGLMSVDVASEHPIYGILSGPAGGVAGALYVARRAGFEDVLTFDMGGTSTDVALCQNGQPTIERQTEIPYGLGLPGEVIPVKVPSVNVRSVGAGGGSIAHVPEVTGALRVGPQSAGADPGPACYGKGGTEPTVTDANVIVGHLPPQLLGGGMELHLAGGEGGGGEKGGG